MTPMLTRRDVIGGAVGAAVAAALAPARAIAQTVPQGQVWFGANLPAPPTMFSTVSSPPAPANTNRGSYYTPGSGGDSGLTLQQAIDDAAAATGSNGDVIVLQAGATYTTGGYFNLPARSGAGWIYIVSSGAPDIGGSGLPAAGTRIGPTSIANMASLRTSANTQNGYLLRTSNSANHYRFVGVDFQLQDSNAGSGNLQTCISLQHGDTSVSTLCTDITFDRCYIAGGPTLGCVHGIIIDGIRIEVTECYIERCFSTTNADSQCILGFNGTGPYRIHNNWLHAGGETTLWGGADSTLGAGIISSDIYISSNHYYKSWFTGAGSVVNGSDTLTITAVTNDYLYPSMLVSDAQGHIPSGTYIVRQLSGTAGSTGTYQISAAATSNASGDAISATENGKNMLEFKAAQRVLVTNNLFENAGAFGQPRSAFTLTVRNQNGSNPWNTVSDVEVANNLFTNCQYGGINILLQDNNYSGNYNTAPSYRILFRNNLWLLATNDGSDSTSSLLVSSNSPSDNSGGGAGGDLIFDHNTFVGTAATGIQDVLVFGGGGTDMQLQRCVWSNNIWTATQYGFLYGGAVRNYSAAIPTQCTSGTFIANVLTACQDSTMPAGNFRPSSNAGVGFVSFGSAMSAAGYALSSGSPYKAAGISGAGSAYNSEGTPDGTDIGCDISKVLGAGNLSGTAGVPNPPMNLTID